MVSLIAHVFSEMWPQNLRTETKILKSKNNLLHFYLLLKILCCFWKGGLSSTIVGISISKSLGTFCILGSLKLMRPTNRAKINVGLEVERWSHGWVRHRIIKKWVCDGYVDCRLAWWKEILLKFWGQEVIGFVL